MKKIIFLLLVISMSLVLLSCGEDIVRYIFETISIGEAPVDPPGKNDGVCEYNCELCEGLLSCECNEHDCEYGDSGGIGGNPDGPLPEKPEVTGGGRWINPVPQPPIIASDPGSQTFKHMAINYSEQGVFLNNLNTNPRLKHEVWIGLDTNADPRNVLGYKLINSNKYLFDRVVLFHAVLAWDHLDPSSPGGMPPVDKRHWCNRTDIHLHLHDRIQWLLADHDKFIKPLKDAGMEVLICPIPGNQGICYSGIGSWPGSTNWDTHQASGGVWGPWSGIGGGANTLRFVRELVDFCDQYDLDGIALDDEYCDVMVSGYGLRNSAHSQGSNTNGQNNIFRWLRYFKDMSTNEKWPNGKLVTVYSHRIPANLPTNLTFESYRYDGSSIPSRQYHVREIVDGLSPGSYGSFQGNLAPAAVPNSQKSPLAIAFDGMGPVVAPTVHAIAGHATNVMRGGYGMIMYFALQHRGHYNSMKYFTNQTGSQLEDWMNEMTAVLYRDGIWYDTYDHPKFPVQLRGNTGGTGALLNTSPTAPHPRNFTTDYF